MAEMSTEDRQRVWRALMRYWSNTWDSYPASKAELLATVNETDTWLENNRASYLSALTYDAEFTGAQVALLFGITALLRKGDVDLVIRALGVEVD